MAPNVIVCQAARRNNSWLRYQPFHPTLLPSQSTSSRSISPSIVSKLLPDQPINVVGEFCGDILPSSLLKAISQMKSNDASFARTHKFHLFPVFVLLYLFFLSFFFSFIVKNPKRKQWKTRFRLFKQCCIASTVNFISLERFRNS